MVGHHIGQGSLHSVPIIKKRLHANLDLASFLAVCLNRDFLRICTASGAALRECISGDRWNETQGKVVSIGPEWRLEATTILLPLIAKYTILCLAIDNKERTEILYSQLDAVPINHTVAASDFKVYLVFVARCVRTMTIAGEVKIELPLFSVIVTCMMHRL